MITDEYKLPKGYSTSQLPFSKHIALYNNVPLPEMEYPDQYISRGDAVRACWQDHYNRVIEEYNKDLEYFDRIVGVPYHKNRYHPECLPNGVDMNIQLSGSYTYRSHNIEHVLCAECGQGIVSNDERDEFYEHIDGCICWSCETVSDFVETHPHLGNAVIMGYQAGINKYAENRGLTIQEYQRLVNKLGNAWYDGYMIGKRQTDENPF